MLKFAMLYGCRPANDTLTTPDGQAVLEEFEDTFPEDLPPLPPTRSVQHQVDLDPGASAKSDTLQNIS